MKVVFSQLKKYIPALDLDPRRVGEIFTEIGYMQDGPILEIEIFGQKDFLLDLEVRQNRADCFGVMGLARDLAAYIGSDLAMEDYEIKSNSVSNLRININSKDAVKRVLAVRIDKLNIGPSPEWLKEYLAVYDINSINNLVDITNYVMIETAHPSHAFDIEKSGEELTWEINPTYKKMTSLDGTQIDLTSDALVVSDGSKPLALAGLVGGDFAAIDSDTKSAIIEMAVYDGGLIRRNSRQMKVMTEASLRLEKYMDPKSLPGSFAMLVEMVVEICGGEVSSDLLDEIINNEEIDPINVSLSKAEQIAGVSIPKERALEYLIRLGFEIQNQNDDEITVLRPVNRLDVEGEFDVIEEIIRMYGYYSLPTDDLPLQAVPDVTPSHLVLIDKVKDILISRGYDEVRSWVLVDEEMNAKSKISNWEVIKVENSINEGVPVLRQSLVAGLMSQLQIYRKKFISEILLFEIGKVFGKSNNEYNEHYALSMAMPGSNISNLQMDLTAILNNIGVTEVIYELDESGTPEYAHPKTNYRIYISNGIQNDRIEIGKIFAVNKTIGEDMTYLEVNINEVDQFICEHIKDVTTTSELEGKLVSLDITINSESKSEIESKVLQLLAEYRENVWGWEVIDVYNDNYTLRVMYSGLSDPEAKELHNKIFA